MRLIILKCDLFVTRIVRFRIWTSGRLFNTPSHINGTHKMHGIADPTKQISASQEGFLSHGVRQPEKVICSTEKGDGKQLGVLIITVEHNHICL